MFAQLKYNTIILIGIILFVCVDAKYVSLNVTGDNYIERYIGEHINDTNSYLNVTIISNSSKCEPKFYFGFVESTDYIPSWNELSEHVSLKYKQKYNSFYFKGFGDDYPIFVFKRDYLDVNCEIELFYEAFSFEQLDKPVTSDYQDYMMKKGHGYIFNVEEIHFAGDFLNLDFEVKLITPNISDLTAIDVFPMSRHVDVDFDWNVLESQHLENSTEDSTATKIKLTQCMTFSNKNIVGFFVKGDKRDEVNDFFTLQVRYVGKSWNVNKVQNSTTKRFILNPNQHLLLEFSYNLFEDLKDGQFFKASVFGSRNELEVYSFGDLGKSGFIGDEVCGSHKIESTFEANTHYYSSFVTKPMSDANNANRYSLFLLLVNPIEETFNVFVENGVNTPIINEIKYDDFTFATFTGYGPILFKFTAPEVTNNNALMINHVYVDKDIEFELVIADVILGEFNTDKFADEPSKLPRISKKSNSGGLVLIIETNRMVANKDYYVTITPTSNISVFDKIFVTYETQIVNKLEMPYEPLSIDVNKHFYVFEFDVIEVFDKYSNWGEFTIKSDRPASQQAVTLCVVNENFAVVNFVDNDNLIERNKFPIGKYYFVVHVERELPATHLFVDHKFIPTFGEIRYNQVNHLKFSTSEHYLMIPMISDENLEILDSVNVKVMNHRDSLNANQISIIIGTYSPVLGQIDLKPTFSNTLFWEHSLLVDKESSGQVSFRQLYESTPQHLLYFTLVNLETNVDYEFDIEINFKNVPQQTLIEGQNIVRNCFGESYTRLIVDMTSDSTLTYVTFYMDESLGENDFNIYTIYDTDAIKVNPSAISNDPTKLQKAITYKLITSSGFDRHVEFYLSTPTSLNIVNTATVVLEHIKIQQFETFNEHKRISSKPITSVIDEKRPLILKYDDILNVDASNDLLVFNMVNSDENSGDIDIQFYKGGYQLDNNIKSNNPSVINTVTNNDEISLVYPGETVYVVVQSKVQLILTMYVTKKPKTADIDWVFNLKTQENDSLGFLVNTNLKNIFGFQIQLDPKMENIYGMNITFESDKIKDHPDFELYIGSSKVKIDEYFWKKDINPNNNGVYSYLLLPDATEYQMVIENLSYTCLLYVPSEVSGTIKIDMNKYVVETLNVNVDSKVTKKVMFNETKKLMNIYRIDYDDNVYDWDVKIESVVNTAPIYHIETVYYPLRGLAIDNVVDRRFKSYSYISVVRSCSSKKVDFCSDLDNFMNENNGFKMTINPVKQNQTIFSLNSEELTGGKDIILKKQILNHIIDLKYVQTSDNTFLSIYRNENVSDSITFTLQFYHDYTEIPDSEHDFTFTNETVHIPLTDSYSNRIYVHYQHSFEKDVKINLQYSVYSADNLLEYPIQDEQPITLLKGSTMAYKLKFKTDVEFYKVTVDGVAVQFASNYFMRVSSMKTVDNVNTYDYPQADFKVLDIINANDEKTTIKQRDSTVNEVYFLLYGQKDKSTISITTYKKSTVVIDENKVNVTVKGYVEEENIIELQIPFDKYQYADRYLNTSLKGNSSVELFSFDENNVYQPISIDVLTQKNQLQDFAESKIYKFYLISSKKNIGAQLLYVQMPEIKTTVALSGQSDITFNETTRFYLDFDTVPELIMLRVNDSSIQHNIGNEYILSNADDLIVFQTKLSGEVEKLNLSTIRITVSVQNSKKPIRIICSDDVHANDLSLDKDTIMLQEVVATKLHKYIIHIDNVEKAHVYRMMFEELIQMTKKDDKTVIKAVIKSASKYWTYFGELNKGVYLYPDVDTWFEKGISIANNELVFYIFVDTFTDSAYRMQYAIDDIEYVDLELGVTKCDQRLLSKTPKQYDYCQKTIHNDKTQTKLSSNLPYGFVDMQANGVFTIDYNVARNQSCRIEVLPKGIEISVHDYPSLDTDSVISQPFWTQVSFIRENPHAEITTLKTGGSFEYRVVCENNGDFYPVVTDFDKCQYDGCFERFKWTPLHDNRELTSDSKMCFDGYSSCSKNTESLYENSFIDKYVYFYTAYLSEINIDVTYPKEKDMRINAGKNSIALKKGFTTKLFLNKPDVDKYSSYIGSGFIKVSIVDFIDMKQLNKEQMLNYSANNKNEVGAKISYRLESDNSAYSSYDLHLGVEHFNFICLEDYIELKADLDVEIELEIILTPHFEDIPIINTQTCVELLQGEYYYIRSDWEELQYKKDQLEWTDKFEINKFEDDGDYFKIKSLQQVVDKQNGYGKSYVIYVSRLEAYSLEFGHKICIKPLISNEIVADHVLNYGDINIVMNGYSTVYLPKIYVPFIHKWGITDIVFNVGTNILNKTKDFIYFTDMKDSDANSYQIIFNSAKESWITKERQYYQAYSNKFTIRIVKNTDDDEPLYFTLAISQGIHNISIINDKTTQLTYDINSILPQQRGLYIDGDFTKMGILTVKTTSNDNNALHIEGQLNGYGYLSVNEMNEYVMDVEQLKMFNERQFMEIYSNKEFDNTINDKSSIIYEFTMHMFKDIPIFEINEEKSASRYLQPGEMLIVKIPEDTMYFYPEFSAEFAKGSIYEISHNDEGYFNLNSYDDSNFGKVLSKENNKLKKLLIYCKNSSANQCEFNFYFSKLPSISNDLIDLTVSNTSCFTIPPQDNYLKFTGDFDVIKYQLFDFKHYYEETTQIQTIDAIHSSDSDGFVPQYLNLQKLKNSLIPNTNNEPFAMCIYHKDVSNAKIQVIEKRYVTDICSDISLLSFDEITDKSLIKTIEKRYSELLEVVFDNSISWIKTRDNTDNIMVDEIEPSIPCQKALKNLACRQYTSVKDDELIPIHDILEKCNIRQIGDNIDGFNRLPVSLKHPIIFRETVDEVDLTKWFYLALLIVIVILVVLMIMKCNVFNMVKKCGKKEEVSSPILADKGYENIV
eukprot:TRINITY_DN2595_c0_g1_i1.p1 TRINITY_DN2595_c0_g1~~TRINITY_DN2595_c0_g1_i1.p1  ORF type:complete len:2876 (+),score=846.14 TRINITY_DN2595_c0_g1_i1:35-8629(+)